MIRVNCPDTSKVDIEVKVFHHPGVLCKDVIFSLALSNKELFKSEAVRCLMFLAWNRFIVVRVYANLLFDTFALLIYILWGGAMVRLAGDEAAGLDTNSSSSSSNSSLLASSESTFAVLSVICLSLQSYSGISESLRIHQFFKSRGKLPLFWNRLGNQTGLCLRRLLRIFLTLGFLVLKLILFLQGNHKTSPTTRAALSVLLCERFLSILS